MSEEILVKFNEKAAKIYTRQKAYIGGDGRTIVFPCEHVRYHWTHFRVPSISQIVVQTKADGAFEYHFTGTISSITHVLGKFGPAVVLRIENTTGLKWQSELDLLPTRGFGDLPTDQVVWDPLKSFGKELAHVYSLETGVCKYLPIVIDPYSRFNKK